MIKRLIVLLLSFIFMPAVHATSATRIQIKIDGPIKDNRYFLCMSGTGCLSIMAAKKGKVFPILRPVQMNNIFILNLKNNMRITPQGLPSSCDKTVNPNQTITITARLTNGKNNLPQLNGLHCSVS